MIITSIFIFIIIISYYNRKLSLVITRTDAAATCATMAAFYFSHLSNSAAGAAVVATAVWNYTGAERTVALAQQELEVYACDWRRRHLLSWQIRIGIRWQTTMWGSAVVGECRTTAAAVNPLPKRQRIAQRVENIRTHTHTKHEHIYTYVNSKVHVRTRSTHTHARTQTRTRTHSSPLSGPPPHLYMF